MAKEKKKTEVIEEKPKRKYVRKAAAEAKEIKDKKVTTAEMAAPAKAEAAAEKPKRKYVRKTVPEKAAQAAPAAEAQNVTKAKKTVKKADVKKAEAAAEKPKRKYVRKAVSKSEEVRTEVPASDEQKKTAAVKPAANTEAAAGKPKRKYVRKAAAEVKAPVKTGTFITLQFAGNEYDLDAVKAKVEEDIRAKFNGAVKSVDIYIKPEENAVYYAVNGNGSDDYKVSLS